MKRYIDLTHPIEEDMPSPSPVEDPGEAIHKTLLRAGIVIVEAVKDLSGAHCRVPAVVEN